MPTTLTGLLVFVVLLLPGFTFIAIRERSAPRRVVSPFRETANMATVSVTSALAGATILALARVVLPGISPDIGAIARDGIADYAEGSYDLLAVWGAGYLVLATAGAAWAARKLRNRTPHPSAASAWWRLFDEWPNGRHVEVTCTLDDGSWVRGRVKSFDDSSHDTADRDLLLEAPISYAFGPAEEFQSYHVSAVCISARRVVAMFVSYGHPDDGSQPSVDLPAAAASADPTEPMAEAPVLPDRPRGAGVQDQTAAHFAGPRGPSAALSTRSLCSAPELAAARTPIPDQTQPSEPVAARPQRPSAAAQASPVLAAAQEYDQPRQPLSRVGQAPKAAPPARGAFC
jgi:hypothetical protein